MRLCSNLFIAGSVCVLVSSLLSFSNMLSFQYEVFEEEKEVTKSLGNVSAALPPLPFTAGQGETNIANITLTNRNVWRSYSQSHNHDYEGIRPGAFIHVGKTAGSTLAQQLRFGCHSFVKKPCPLRKKNLRNETMVSKLTTYIHTPDFKLLTSSESYKKFVFYLFTLRDPFERTLSVLTFGHPLNKMSSPKDKNHHLYFDCFRTMDELATYLSDDEKTIYSSSYFNLTRAKNATDCKQMVRGMILGAIKTTSHFYYGFARIVKSVRNWDQGPSILAIRTEYLKQDWQTANLWLGQKAPIFFDESRGVRVYPHSQYKVTKKISDASRACLCKHLVNEYRFYLGLVQHSSNLSQKDKQSSLALARKKCPELDLFFP